MNKSILLVLIFSFSFTHTQDQAKPTTRYFPTLNREALFDCALDFTIFCVIFSGANHIAYLSNEDFDSAKNASQIRLIGRHYTWAEYYTTRATLSGLFSLGLMVGSIPFLIKALSQIPYIFTNPSPEKIVEEKPASHDLSVSN